VRLAISDTGRGMTDEVKAHLFEPFFTTKERGRGTGLGLAMVYGAVQQMGGTIDVQSTLGAGTTVRLLLPGLPDENAGSAAARPADALAARGGHETILLAEDDAAVRRLATRLLERLGYRVVPCVDGAQALEVAAQLGASLDLLLTDIVMPGMNGRVLAERLRAARPALRVVLTSGYSEDLLGDAAPGDDVHFIAKPYTSESLARKVREALDDEDTRA
jgi:CheY-like chemotaxis protein